MEHTAQKARRKVKAKAKKETCRKREEKKVGVYSMTLGQGDSRECHPFGEC